MMAVIGIVFLTLCSIIIFLSYILYNHSSPPLPLDIPNNEIIYASDALDAIDDIGEEVKDFIFMILEKEKNKIKKDDVLALLQQLKLENPILDKIDPNKL